MGNIKVRGKMQRVAIINDKAVRTTWQIIMSYVPGFFAGLFGGMKEMSYICSEKSDITRNITIMKERILMKLVAILMICGATVGLMSCGSDDIPVINDVKTEDVLGTWYTEFDQAGVYGEGESAKPYAKAVLYGSFYEGNSGLFVCLFVDADGKAVDLGDTFLGAGCEYTVAPDGKVDIRLTGNSEAVTLSPKWSMTYRDGQLIGKVLNDVELRMSRITEAQRAKYQEWMRQLGLGNDTGIASTQGNIVDLSTVEYGYYEAHDGDILTGLLDVVANPDHIADCNIVIPDGATITLRNAIIGGEYFIRYSAWSEKPGIICQGNATILLEGENEVVGNYDGLPCIHVKPNCKLTIKAPYVPLAELPKLRVYNGGREGTAIGGGLSNYRDCGNITIERCILNANGDADAPNIGCPEGASCGSIQFLDGCQVESWGGWDNVAVGCGPNGSCGEVFISEGSTVIAHAGHGNSAAIGASEGGTCYRIIAEGNVKAYRYWSTSETLPVSAWLNAYSVFLNRRIDKDIHDYMIADGLNVDRDDIIPAMRRNKNEFIIDYQ